MKVFRYALIAIVALLAICFVSGKYFYWGTRSVRSSDGFCAPDEMCAGVSRRYYPARHWQWSGIFPFEGGFIPDPHFTSSQTMPLPDSVRKLIGSEDASFQIVDVNPAFNDNSSEILLLIRSKGTRYEYSLDFPEGRGVQAVIASPDLPWARAVPYRGQIAILTDFIGPSRGFYLVGLPLRSGMKLDLAPVGSPRFEEIAGTLKDQAADPSVKREFCETRSNTFASFYKKYLGSCG
jgi:hypothetical protein